MGNLNMISNAHWGTSLRAFDCMSILVTDEAAPGNNAALTDTNIFFNHYPRPVRNASGGFLIFAANAHWAHSGDG